MLYSVFLLEDTSEQWTLKESQQLPGAPVPLQHHQSSNLCSQVCEQQQHKCIFSSVRTILNELESTHQWTRDLLMSVPFILPSKLSNLSSCSGLEGICLSLSQHAVGGKQDNTPDIHPYWSFRINKHVNSHFHILADFTQISQMIKSFIRKYRRITNIKNYYSDTEPWCISKQNDKSNWNFDPHPAETGFHPQL